MIFTRKRFGQHFLHDRAVLERIAREMAPQPDQALVEIGPGRGVADASSLQAAVDLCAALGARRADARAAERRP